MSLVNVREVSRETTLCLAAAHALVRLDDGTIVGDPMEKITLENMDWGVGKTEKPEITQEHVSAVEAVISGKPQAASQSIAIETLFVSRILNKDSRTQSDLPSIQKLAEKLNADIGQILIITFRR
ncbi:hypothetical protein GG344DRAFT_82917 [Lentinula edodes]|nr:hypothetical protein GG344DRAFT_82917 [Lentinula edodes]